MTPWRTSQSVSSIESHWSLSLRNCVQEAAIGLFRRVTRHLPRFIADLGSVGLDVAHAVRQHLLISGSTGKGSNMTIHKSGGRKLLSRVLAAGVLLSMYAFGTVATTGALGVSPAYAQRGRGRGVGRGRGGGWGRGGGDLGAAIGIGVVRPSSAARSRRERRSSRTQSTIVCSASGRTIPRAGPIWVTTATAIPVRDGWTIACTYFRTPARCRVFLFFRCVAPDNSLATMCLHRLSSSARCARRLFRPAVRRSISGHRPSALPSSASA